MAKHQWVSLGMSTGSSSRDAQTAVVYCNKCQITKKPENAKAECSK